MSSSPIGIAGIMWLAWGAYWGLAALRVKRDQQAEPAGLRLAHLALLGAAFLVEFALVPLPPLLQWVIVAAPWTWIGVPITAAALAFAVWARVHLGAYWSGRITVKEGHQLIRTGPYGLARHPIYTGLVLGFAGTAVASGRVEGFLGFAFVAIAYAIKIPREEKVLAAQFSEYADYRRTVRAVVPFVL
jgi:protein-S-isoprenylcysteine O-methyltransferase Ste14